MINKRLVFLVMILLLTGCSQSVSKDPIVTNNSNIVQDRIVQQEESDHFIFYTKEQDKACIEDLSRMLEDQYTRITDNLNTTVDKKVSIYIYPDLSTFHAAINQPDAPDWVVGTAVPGTTTIKMVNPAKAGNRPYSDMLKVVVHEFTHIVTMSINPDVNNIPLWLSEGIAVFEADQSQGTDETLSQAKSSGKYPDLKSLERDPYNFGTQGGYQFSYSIIEYMVDTYGYDKVMALIKSPSEFEKILGLSEEAFQKQWVADL